MGERGSKRDRGRDRETERDRERQREAERDRETETESQRDRETERERQRYTERHRERHRERVLTSTFKVVKSRPGFKFETSFNFFHIKSIYLCIPYNVCYGLDLSLNGGCLTHREGG